LKSFLFILVVLITAVLTIFSVLRTPSFQKFAARIAVEYVSRTYGIEIYLDKLRISDMLSIELQGFLVKDQHHNTLLETKDLRVQIREVSLKENYVWLSSITVDHLDFMLRQYEGDSLVNMDVLLHKLPKGSSDTTSSVSTPWTIYCDDLMLAGTSFSYNDERLPHDMDVMDFNDILVQDINIEAKDVLMIGDSIAARVQHLSFNEKSGLQVNDFSTIASVSSTGIRADNLELKMDHTTASMDVDFLYHGWDKLSYFLDSVIIDARIRTSVLTLSDLGCYSQELRQMDDPIMFSGNIKGSITDFAAKDFKFSLGHLTEFQGDVAMKGLPDIYTTYWDINFREFMVTVEDFRNFSLPLPDSSIVLPEQLNKMGLTGIKGTFKGLYNDFTTDLSVTSDIGAVTVAGIMKKDGTGVPVYSGEVTAKSLNLEVLTGSKDLGLCDIDLEFEGKSLDPDKIDGSLNGWVENLDFMDHSYEKIVFGGKILGKSFDGRILVMDPGLQLAFNGKIDLNGELAAFDYTCDLETAKFYDLNLSDKSPDMDLRCKLSARFTGLNLDEFSGNVSIRGLVYHENGQDYRIDSIDLHRVRTQGVRDYTELRSDIVDATVEGPLLIQSLPSQLEGLIFDPDSHPVSDEVVSDTADHLKFDIVFKNMDPVSEVFFPTVMVSPGASLHGWIDFSKNRIEFKALADSVNTSGVRSDSIALLGSSKSGRLILDGYIKNIILSKESDSNEISMPNFRIKADAGHDSVNFDVAWDNHNPLVTNHANISGYLKFPSTTRIEARLLEAHAELNNLEWNLEGENYFIIDPAFKEIRNLNIRRKNEVFTVNGKLSDQPEDTLGFYFKDWSLSSFNTFLEHSSISLDGIINGKFGIFMNDSVPNIFADLNITDFILNGVMFGEAAINSHWMESEKAMAVEVDLYSNSESGEHYRVLGVNGLYYPFDDNRNFDFDIRAQNLDISAIEPLLSSFSSKVAGFATGKLTLKGTVADPELTGSLKLLRAELKIDYLNVTYSFSNEITFDKDFIHFDKISVIDRFNNEGIVSGGIRHDHFRNFSLDITIETKNLLAIDLNRYQNDVFYGMAFATGTIRLSGPFSRINIEVDAITEKGTKVTIPINYSADVSQTDFIIFNTEMDTLKVEGHHDVQVEGVSLDINMKVTKEADIEISLPGNIGYIKANGNGELRLGVDPNGYLNLTGSYRIQSGLFLFSLEQLVSRRFEIMEGSSITWTGDINDAEVNIVARYRLRTSLTGLGSSLISDEAASQKVNVNTDIRMTGSLFNPDLSFGITFPNMQEQDKQAVYAVLDTNDQALMNQQAISLLVLNSFSTTGSGISNPVNPATIMSNTLSSMLSQISNDFNIGINYVPGDRVTTEQLEVALSTQLLDDRLLIDGNIDYSPNNNTTQQTSAIVGDVNIEYKLTRDGRFRIKAFNRSNDLSLLNDYAPYTQGVGIFYRKEFSDIKELFTGKAKKKKEQPSQ
jgi:hypothetical protein